MVQLRGKDVNTRRGTMNQTRSEHWYIFVLFQNASRHFPTFAPSRSEGTGNVGYERKGGPETIILKTTANHERPNGSGSGAWKCWGRGRRERSPLDRHGVFFGPPPIQPISRNPPQSRQRKSIDGLSCRHSVVVTDCYAGVENLPFYC